jgi:2-amino-4-hydroxy-6-hydroxymethyldihydropteridine diphosphokinase
MDDERLDSAIIIGLGGNLNDAGTPCAQTLAKAASAFGGFGLKVKAKSSLWRSQAWPNPDDPPFLNAVAIVETQLDPAELLERLKALEAAHGRCAAGLNAPRTLDLDLIAYGRRIVSTERLELPHPRAAERLFVMGPLAEIIPTWRHPFLGLTAQALAARASVARDAAPVEAAAWNIA